MPRPPPAAVLLAALGGAAVGFLLGRLSEAEPRAADAPPAHAPAAPSTGPTLLGAPPPPARPAAPVDPATGDAPAPDAPTADAPTADAQGAASPGAGTRESGDARAPEPLVLPRGFAPRIEGALPAGPVEPEPAVPPRVAEAERLLASQPEEAVRAVDALLASSDAAERAGAYRVLGAARHPAQRAQVKRALDEARPGDDVRGLLRALARYKGRPWGAEQLTGPPDTPLAGDLETAWASKQPEMGEVWIDLTYAEAVTPELLRVHETYNPGAVARVLVSEDGPEAPDRSWRVAWEGEDGVRAAPGWLEVPLAGAGRVRWVRLIVDTDRVPGWNEIDAVELLGDGRRQWAVSALAGSSYAD